MDAVFHPKLDRLDFKQEGWRLENEVPTGKIETSINQTREIMSLLVYR